MFVLRTKEAKSGPFRRPQDAIEREEFTPSLLSQKHTEKPMALVLEISPETEARLRMYAAERGQDVTEYLVELAEYSHVIDLSEFEDQADFEDSVAGIREGLADLEAGQTYSLEETFAYLKEQRDARRKEKEAQASQHFQKPVTA